MKRCIREKTSKVFAYVMKRKVVAAILLFPYGLISVGLILIDKLLHSFGICMGL